MLILEAETGRATQRSLMGQKWSLEELGKAQLVNPDSWEAEAEERSTEAKLEQQTISQNSSARDR